MKTTWISNLNTRPWFGLNSSRKFELGVGISASFIKYDGKSYKEYKNLSRLSYLDINFSGYYEFQKSRILLVAVYGHPIVLKWPC